MTTTALEFIEQDPRGKTTSSVVRLVETKHLNWDTLRHESNLILRGRGTLFPVAGNHYVFLVSTRVGYNQKIDVHDEVDMANFLQILKEEPDLAIQVMIENTRVKITKCLAIVLVAGIMLLRFATFIEELPSNYFRVSYLVTVLPLVFMLVFDIRLTTLLSFFESDIPGSRPDTTLRAIRKTKNNSLRPSMRTVPQIY